LIELTTTRTNPMIDPSLHVWGWEIPVYLFLGGLVAGMMVLTGFLLLSRDARRGPTLRERLPGLALVLLSAGMGALFLDLEHKPFVWRLYTTFEARSPMSWGAWILLLVYPALAVALLLNPPTGLKQRLPVLERWRVRLAQRPAVARLTGGLILGVGVLLGIYTGVLLSSLGARPLWNSALLGPLFLVSGLSSAAAVLHLLTKDAAEKALLERADVSLLAGELAVLTLYLIGLLSSTAVHRDAAALLLGGPYTAFFWVAVVGLGLLLPLALQLAALGHRVRHTVAAPLLVVAGGLALRFLVVNAGQFSRWSAF